MGKEALDNDDETTARGIDGGGEGETARPLPTFYYHSPSLPTLYFISPFIIIKYFVLYSERNLLVILEPSPRTSHPPRLTTP